MIKFKAKILYITLKCANFSIPSVEYTVEVEFEENAREYRNDRFLKALTQIEIDNVYKGLLRKKRNLDDKELIREIMVDEALTENEKILLTEAW